MSVEETYAEARARALSLLTDEDYEGLETVREVLQEGKADPRVDAVRRMVKEWAIALHHSPDEAAEILAAQGAE